MTNAEIQRHEEAARKIVTDLRAGYDGWLGELQYVLDMRNGLKAREAFTTRVEVKVQR